MDTLNQMIKNIFKYVFDPEAMEWKTKEHPKGTLDTMKTTLGKIYTEIARSNQRLELALYAPIMVGGGLVYVGQNGGGPFGNSYVSSDRPANQLFSTARIIAKVLKENEETLKQTLPKEALEKLAENLKDLHGAERELYEKIYVIDQYTQHLDEGEAEKADNSTIKDLKALVEKAREKHEEAKEKRTRIAGVLGVAVPGVAVIG